MKMKRLAWGLLLVVLHAAWFLLLARFPDFSLFIVFVPLAVVFNITRNARVRNTYISIFIIFWLALFQYESVRGFLLNDRWKLNAPKTRFLFPPAGWIMFYTVEPEAGYFEVLGVKGRQTHVIDPHHIFRVRTIGYDNIHRGILGTAYNPDNPYVAADFCRYLNYRFPDFDEFLFMGYFYPNIIEKPFDRRQRIIYRCDETHVRF
ncbi:MAG: hypothetical protein KC900_12550 [Candidatus Omnitrophica bacterium]|nr:hypothetical protein [Candidatus Omnitrophota bacterium]